MYAHFYLEKTLHRLKTLMKYRTHEQREKKHRKYEKLHYVTTPQNITFV